MKQPLTAVTLRPVTLADAARITDLIGDWAVVRWLSGPPYPFAVSDAVAFLMGSEAQGVADARTSAILVDGLLAGVVGIDVRNSGFNLGYWLGRPYWGHGIMTRAARQVTRDFFANSSESKLNSGYFSGNEASWAIQKRLGFQMSGEALLFSRSNGKRLAHVDTMLTRAKFDEAVTMADSQSNHS